LLNLRHKKEIRHHMQIFYLFWGRFISWRWLRASKQVVIFKSLFKTELNPNKL